MSEAKSAGKSGVEKESQGSLWKEYIKAGVVAMALALSIRPFVAQAFTIP